MGIKKDIGFWDINGNYIKDIQEVDEMEMDKEIIIDGVNVAGCEQYFEQSGEVVCALIDQYFCEGNPNCHYKQLKRLEQENAELKEKIKKYAAINEQETKDYAELKAENERLKENDCEQCKHLDLYIKYKQTLQEIKEIIEKGQWDFAGVTEKQILQKISEVE